MADADRLQLVVENLVENASKYTPAGGKVTLGYSAGTSQAIINVRDTGIGIARKDQKNIFDIYTRANSQHSIQVGGSGLGLYLVKKLVDLHHGKVTITSKPKVGSTFSLRLPYK
jgi:signal transduction histidine kinase